MHVPRVCISGVRTPRRRRRAIALFAVTIASAAFVAPAFGGTAARTNPRTPALGSVTRDSQGDVAILIGEPGNLSAAPLQANTAPSSCGYGYTCAYDETNYGTSGYAYAFPERYSNYQNLAGGCWAVDSGFPFNDCAKSAFDDYGSCAYAVFYWNAGYTGTTWRNNDNSGSTNLGGNSDQFSSQIDCD